MLLVRSAKLDLWYPFRKEFRFDHAPPREEDMPVLAVPGLESLAMALLRREAAGSYRPLAR